MAIPWGMPLVFGGWDRWVNHGDARLTYVPSNIDNPTINNDVAEPRDNKPPNQLTEDADDNCRVIAMASSFKLQNSLKNGNLWHMKPICQTTVCMYCSRSLWGLDSIPPLTTPVHGYARFRTQSLLQILTKVICSISQALFITVQPFAAKTWVVHFS